MNDRERQVLVNRIFLLEEVLTEVDKYLGECDRYGRPKSGVVNAIHTGSKLHRTIRAVLPEENRTRTVPREMP